MILDFGFEKKKVLGIFIILDFGFEKKKVLGIFIIWGEI